MTARFRSPAAAAILVVSLAACGQTASPTGAPTAGASAPVASAAASGAGTVAPPPTATTAPSAAGDIAAFCTDFTTRLRTAWPPADAATAVQLGPVFGDFATNVALSEIAPDLQTIDVWTQAAARGESTTPPPEVAHAFGRIGAWVTNNC